MEALDRRAVSLKSLLLVLGGLPSGVDAMYEQALERLGEASEEELELSKRALFWIVHAREPLALQDLQHAVAISYEDKVYDPDSIVPVDVLLAACGGLVEIRNIKRERW